MRTRLAGRAFLSASALAALLAACAGLPSRGDLVSDALRAQLGGPDACVPVTHDTTSSRFFPSVRITVGRCPGDEGKRVLAGTDAGGAVYLLGSTPGFTFLLTRHPPVHLDSVSALDYARDALTLSGMLEPDARPVSLESELPDSIRSELRRTGGAFSPTRLLEDREDVWVLSLTALSATRLTNIYVTVSKRTGVPHGSGTVLWRSSGDNRKPGG